MQPTTNTLPGVFGLLKQSILFYRNHFKSLVSIGLVVVVYGVITYVIISLIVPYPTVAGSLPSVGTMIATGIVAFILSIVGFILQILFSIAIIKGIKKNEDGTVFGIKEIYKESLPLFWPSLWVSILFVALSLGGYLLLIIPGIILTTYAALSGLALIYDGKRGMSALTSSFYYVRGNWWKVFWRFLGIHLIFIAIAIVIFAVVALLFYSLADPYSPDLLKDLVKSLNSGFWGLLIKAIQGFVWACVIAPITIHYSYSIYKYLKTLKPEPNPETDLKKPYKWFTGISIFGVVVVPIVIIGVMLSVVFLSFDTARERAASRMEKIRQTSNTSLITLPDSLNFSIQNPARLESKAYVNKDLGFSIRPPKGWGSEAIESSIIFRDLLKKEGEIDAVIEVQYFDKESLPDDAAALEISQEILRNNPTLTSATFGKGYIGPRLAYRLAARFDEEPYREARYFLVTHESGLYVISAFWWSTSSTEIQVSVLDSIASFNTVE